MIGHQVDMEGKTKEEGWMEGDGDKFGKAWEFRLGWCERGGWIDECFREDDVAHLFYPY